MWGRAVCLYHGSNGGMYGKMKSLRRRRLSLRSAPCRPLHDCWFLCACSLGGWRTLYIKLKIIPGGEIRGCEATLVPRPSARVARGLKQVPLSMRRWLMPALDVVHLPCAVRPKGCQGTGFPCSEVQFSFSFALIYIQCWQGESGWLIMKGKTNSWRNALNYMLKLLLIQFSRLWPIIKTSIPV